MEKSGDGFALVRCFGSVTSSCSFASKFTFPWVFFTQFAGIDLWTSFSVSGTFVEFALIRLIPLIYVIIFIFLEKTLTVF